MRSIVLFFVVLFLIVACEVPQGIQSSPSNSNNTSGTLGSSPATDKPATPVQVPDTSKVKRDSLPG